MQGVSEIVDFGPSLGTEQIVQLAGEAFHNACLQVNSKNVDNTGLRIHAGAHVAIRFLLANSILIGNRRVCELGCGTGVFGLIGTRGGSIPSQLVLTDGNPDTVEIAKLNVQQLAAPSSSSKVSCHQLLWGSKVYVDNLLLAHTELSGSGSFEQLTEPDETSAQQYSKLAAEDILPAVPLLISSPFSDVVIGCELFYYRTNVEELLYTVLQLTDSKGIFIHSHVFRRPGQDSELINYLFLHGWITVEIPVQLFVEEKELADHPEWYGVHTLISGPEDRVNRLMESRNRQNDLQRESAAESAPAFTSSDNSSSSSRSSELKTGAAAGFKWRIFRGVTDESCVEEDSSGCDGDDGFNMANLFTLPR